ncbi:hypothetical protein HQQ82_01050 [Rathayibacter sp. VKM Ac-2856]|uniref:hypothetical protein n=1 Tax=unclassified Rathayibacter TaxID=2609250 RepID=UPI001566DD53|nr:MULTISPECIES: hypothetical protein [unclassified Rathayibacter]NQX03382.1 hypothetical protein [Rathayibacter sp. VKM Ac-2858]NQX18550.1 hypothetical protein [Rathayibacter sp. VKM Ac-2856]
MTITYPTLPIVDGGIGTSTDSPMTERYSDDAEVPTTSTSAPPSVETEPVPPGRPRDARAPSDAHADPAGNRAASIPSSPRSDDHTDRRATFSPSAIRELSTSLASENAAAHCTPDSREILSSTSDVRPACASARTTTERVPTESTVARTLCSVPTVRPVVRTTPAHIATTITRVRREATGCASEEASASRITGTTNLRFTG